MVLVDTSVWIDHFRRGAPALADLLHEGRVACHPAVVGELACGVLRQRDTTLELLRHLPSAAAATDGEALRFLQDHRLFGRGLGWTDLHLLAAAAVSGYQLWTIDRRLEEAAQKLRLAFDP
ncbi:MAG: PIN domain-containing protein [Candidatus Binatia bacterium]